MKFIWIWIMEPMLFVTIGSSIKFDTLDTGTIPRSLVIIVSGMLGGLKGRGGSGGSLVAVLLPFAYVRCPSSCLPDEPRSGWAAPRCDTPHDHHLHRNERIWLQYQGEAVLLGGMDAQGNRAGCPLR